METPRPSRPAPAPAHLGHHMHVRSRSDGLKRPEPTPGPPGLPFKKGPREADFRLRRLPPLWGRPRPPSRRPRPPGRWYRPRGWAERRFGDLGWPPVSPASGKQWALELARGCTRMGWPYRGWGTEVPCPTTRASLAVPTAAVPSPAFFGFFQQASAQCDCRLRCKNEAPTGCASSDGT